MIIKNNQHIENFINYDNLVINNDKYYYNGSPFTGISRKNYLDPQYANFSFYKDGFIHNENGPAIIYDNGDKFWYKEGKVHREAGPATEYSDGYKEWFYNDEKISCQDNEEFLRIVNLKIFE